MEKYTPRGNEIIWPELIPVFQEEGAMHLRFWCYGTPTWSDGSDYLTIVPGSIADGELFEGVMKEPITKRQATEFCQKGRDSNQGFKWKFTQDEPKVGFVVFNFREVNDPGRLLRPKNHILKRIKSFFPDQKL